MTEAIDDGAELWPLRPWIMAAIGATAGLGFHFLTHHQYSQPLAPWRQALATLVAISTVSLLLTIERRRWQWAIVFALAWGVVIALVGWFTTRYNVVPTIFEWPYFSAIFAVMLAAPLFQTIRDQGRWSLPYERLHSHAWADAVIGAASLFFTGVVFMLATLVAGLFGLIGIEQIQKLLQKGWFDWILAGFAFGAAVGLLREHDRLLPMLQRLVRVVFSVLAPPLAVALVLFLASIPFTGLHKFWNSGVPATPILLVAGAGAILLANTVFAESREARSTSPILRGASLLLVAVILPLAAIAALSIGIRINQYGWTPERIWGVIAAAVAIAYGLAGWFAIWKGRQEFDEPLRPLQAALAVALCGVALFLALPIVDFGAISARSQMARLDSGKVTAAQFDWAAMAFDFGRAGRDRLDAIARGGPAEMRSMAVTALKSTNRWEVTQEKLVAGPTPVSIDTFPKTATVPAELEQLLLHGAKGETAFCSDGGACRVYPQANGASYVVVMDGCANLPPASLKQPTVRCARTIALFEQQKAKWTNVYQADATDLMSERTADLRQQSDALARGDIRIVPVERRQIMIGGEPVGTAF